VKILFYYREGEHPGIGSIAALLKKHGHEVDMIFESGTEIKFGVINNPFRKKTVGVQLNPELIQKAEAFAPDIMAFSSETNIFPYVRKYAEEIKRRTGCMVIVGGVHATSVPEACLSHDFIDVVCRGEGEYPMLELADRLQKGEDIYNIKNLWFSREGSGGKEIIKNEMRPLTQDLDALPFPERDMFFKYKAFENHLMVVCSRGCPYQCSYCVNSLYWKLGRGLGKYVRRRSVENVIQELEEALPKYGSKAIEFEDECFIVNRKWNLEFLKLYKERIGLPFFCQTRPNQITEENVQALWEAGCVQIFVGIESGSQYMREKVMNRRMLNRDIVKAAKIIKSTGIRLQTTAMFGTPGETPEMMFETVDLIDEMKPHAIPTYTTFPFPGTALYKQVVKEGSIDAETIKKIELGEIGKHDHGRMIVKHPHAELAYNISKTLSLYVRSPKVLKPIIKNVFMRNRRSYVVDLAYTSLLLFDYPFFGRERLRIFIKSLLHQGIRGSKGLRTAG
jgi:radical SAM superfamily enzyme YgiQ (UPF0313 family)